MLPSFYLFCEFAHKNLLFKYFLCCLSCGWKGIGKQNGQCPYTLHQGPRRTQYSGHHHQVLQVQGHPLSRRGGQVWISDSSPHGAFIYFFDCDWLSHYPSNNHVYVLCFENLWTLNWWALKYSWMYVDKFDNSSEESTYFSNLPFQFVQFFGLCHKEDWL